MMIKVALQSFKFQTFIVLFCGPSTTVDIIGNSMVAKILNLSTSGDQL